MALIDSNVHKLAPDAANPAYRSAPHNIEAEQGLLGAILVNNDAFYRVSDFLEPKHFFEAIHQQIYETAGSLIRMGKVANPVTLKTFLPAELDLGGMTVSQYLARLAAEALREDEKKRKSRTLLPDGAALAYEAALRLGRAGAAEELVGNAAAAADAYAAAETLLAFVRSEGAAFGRRAGEEDRLDERRAGERGGEGGGAGDAALAKLFAAVAARRDACRRAEE